MSDVPRCAGCGQYLVGVTPVEKDGLLYHAACSGDW